MITIRRYRRFSKDSDYMAFSVVRVYNSHLSALG